MGFELFDSTISDEEEKQETSRKLSHLHFISNFDEFEEKLFSSLDNKQSELSGAVSHATHKDGILQVNFSNFIVAVIATAN